MITDKEIQQYWNFYDRFIIGWFLISAFFILSVVAIPFSIGVWFAGGLWWPWLIYGMVVPVNFVLKYGFGVKNLWFFNDTKDGDFGDPEVLKRYGHENRSKVFKFIWWWFRNLCWNFVMLFKPDWDNGECDEFRIIEQNIPEGSHRFTWCSKYGVHGVNNIAYRINGRVHCRFSKADANKHKQFGSGGNHYRFLMSPIFQRWNK